ncbi:MAG: hypothetical protein UT66_C0026G0011 [candidate division CPR2 bacterium GW2011_GWC1_39_9]|uniref:Putative membrane protein insertion efficiency factor n=1 Tax=candidate division CPR2 bacterium GW2011_GWC2_39_10 TaxID=1618345 RepID=A0A0G0LSV0_UNCC2|nr:MAG: hypothetical protein UT18_C0005G0028 [candidate division CPR2 bacterium GW2011_GWC2_39_10]KKR34259.1 MAG: hypothetical protein UT66_C0026G0011 [candidate division CPR2 bacterium GW2011_GWC1_39_9]
MMRKIGITLINIYQKTLSPDHGPLRGLFPNGACRYQPTCSQYTKEAIEKYGLTKGSFKGALRILRCHPWAKGGEDPVR